MGGGMSSRLSCPLPKAIQIVRVLNELPGQERCFVLSMTLPQPVVDLLAQTLELAARVTGKDKMGGNLAAICMECVGEWSAQAEEAGHMGRLEGYEGGDDEG